MANSKPSRYKAIIIEIFTQHYLEGMSEFEFDRSEIDEVSASLGLPPPKNYGDVFYTFRSRKDLPEIVSSTAPEGLEWIIEGSGRGKYKFKLDHISKIIPNQNLIEIKIPDSTPEIIARYALGDEQALLAKVRYNRLIDIFLGIAAYSLQNHLRTTVSDIGQIEIDEIYVGVNRNGAQFVVPVQAKGGRDRISSVQTKQDIKCCREKFPLLICRAVSAQFMTGDLIALFEMDLIDDRIKIVEEKHYRLVPAEIITEDDLSLYRIHE